MLSFLLAQRFDFSVSGSLRKPSILGDSEHRSGDNRYHEWRTATETRSDRESRIY